MSNQPVEKRRRYFRFSIRSLLVLTAILSVVLAIIAVSRQREQRRLTIQEYHRAGADIRFAYWTNEIVELSTWRPREFGIQRIVQEAPRLRVLRIYNQCDDEILNQISRLKHLEKLRIRDRTRSDQQVNVTDRGMASIARLKSLRVLEIIDCGGVTDAGMAFLSTLPHLESIEMPYSSIGDEGVAQLAKLRSVRNLVLNGTSTSNRSLDYLRSTSTLRVLFIGSAVTNSAIEKFKQDTSVLLVRQ
jgi:hypothetical protein